MWFRRGFPAGGRRQRGAARMRRGETARRWHPCVAPTPRRLPAAPPPARTRVFLVSSVVKRRLGSGYLPASRVGDFLTSRPPPTPPTTSNSRPTRLSRSRRSWARSRSRTAPSPSGSACAPATPSGASPPSPISRVLFSSSRVSFAPERELTPFAGDRTTARAMAPLHRGASGGGEANAPSAPPSFDGRATSAPAPPARRMPTPRVSRLHLRLALPSRTRG